MILVDMIIELRTYLFDLIHSYFCYNNTIQYNTVKLLNNGPPEERPLVNNGQILTALAYLILLLPSRVATPEFPTTDSENYQITASKNSLKFKITKSIPRKLSTLYNLQCLKLPLRKSRP